MFFISACDCDPRGATSELCDQVRGQCSCRLEVTGRRCDHCRTGYWGFPLCRPCQCNGMSEECDPYTGECLNCRQYTVGPNCDRSASRSTSCSVLGFYFLSHACCGCFRCEEGYYGDPVSRQPCEPCLCPDIQGSRRFFATSCHHDPQSLSLTCACREGHEGASPQDTSGPVQGQKVQV